MVSSSLGGGVLSLSYVFVLSGWGTGLILVAIGAIASTWSNLIIAKMCATKGLRNLDDMATRAGGKCLSKTLQLAMILYALGACIGYQIFIAEMFAYIFSALIPSALDFIDSFEFRLVVNVPCAALVLFPLSLKRDMSALAFAGVLSVGALTYTLIVMLIETPFYYKEYVHADQTIIYAFKLDWNILTSFSLVFFAYTCQMSLIPVYSELVNPNYRRISKVVKRALALDCLFYYIIAVSGYMSQFNATSDVVLTRPALSGMDPDYFSLVAALGICIVLFAAFPSNYNPCRNQFFLFAFNEPNYSNKA